MTAIFERLPAHLSPPGLITYGAKDEHRSYIVSFDEKYPELQWRASWAPTGEKMRMLPDGYPSKIAAQRAALSQARDA
jgi:hypothetical protein